MLSFLHIPKSGGTSLRISLSASRVAGRLLVLERDEDLFHTPYNQYRPDSIVFGHVSWRLCNLLGADTRATVLREPISRCMSQVQHWYQHDIDYRETDDIGRNRRVIVRERGLRWNLERLLERRDLPQFRALSNAQTAQIADHDVDRPDVLDGLWLTLAMEHLDQCVLVGVAEAMPGFVSALGRMLGTTLETGRHNEGLERGEALARTLSPDLRAKLLRLNEMDAELYRHAIDRPNRKSSSYKPRRASGCHLNLGITAYERPRGYETFRGNFPLRFCHYLIDVVEAQFRLGAAGAFFLDQWCSPRMAALMTELAGEENTIWIDDTAPDTAEFADLPVLGGKIDGDPQRYVVSNARILDRQSVSVDFRLAFIQSEKAAGDMEAVLDQVMPHLAPLGVAVVANAMTWSGSMNLQRLRAHTRANGLCAVAKVNAHVVVCHSDWGWFYKALLRAKLADWEILRSRYESEEVLEVNCGY